MAVETPTHPGKIPSRRTALGISGRTAALVIGGATLLTAAGVVAYEALGPKQAGSESKPSAPAGIVIQGETPKPIDTANPTVVAPSSSPFQSENPTVAPSAPEIPMPEWAKKIPAQTLSPDKVPLSTQTKTDVKNRAAGVKMMPVDIGLGYIVVAQGETLVQATPTADGTGILACATTGGDKFTKKVLGETTFQGQKLELDQLMGSVCFLFDDSIQVIDQKSQSVSQGLDALAPFLQQGVSFTAMAQGRIPPEKLAIIEKGIKELQARTGTPNDVNLMANNPVTIWVNTFILNS
ncbi:MAG: hypothetical protein M1444_02495 [Patescibacteria group bacterium]|nr:hypothetical protein [Patescibacteria group bacterium]